MKFEYIIHTPCCRSKIFTTDNPKIAEVYSRNGCWVTCVTKNFMVL